METIGQAIKRVQDQSPMTLLVSTGKQCDQHGNKKVYFIEYDGEEFCPLCERELNNILLSQQETAKIQSAPGKRNYFTFSKQSILTDKDLYNASFSNFNAADPEEVKNKQMAMKAFSKYKEGEVFNTWLVGMPGTGKSHLAMSILRNLNEAGEKNKSCVFVSVDEMLRHIRNSFDKKESRYTESYFVDLLSAADYIVLDDLGAETGGTGTKKVATDFTLRVLYAIANARQSKPTIITSNLSKNELVSMYDPKLISRLMKNMLPIDFFNTSDKRIKKIDWSDE